MNHKEAHTAAMKAMSIDSRLQFLYATRLKYYQTSKPVFLIDDNGVFERIEANQDEISTIQKEIEEIEKTVCDYYSGLISR